MINGSKNFLAAGLRGAAAAMLISTCALAMAQGTPGAGSGRSAGASAAMADAPGGMHRPHGAGLAMSGRMLDAVGATADQKTRIHDIMTQAHTDLQAQHAASQNLRKQMIGLMTAPTIDAAAIEVLRHQQLAQHDIASRRMTQAMVDAGSLLTPQQRQQIGERLVKMQDMGERHQRGALGAAKG